jgi:hypothetical protein
MTEALYDATFDADEKFCALETALHWNVIPAMNLGLWTRTKEYFSRIPARREAELVLRPQPQKNFWHFALKDAVNPFAYDLYGPVPTTLGVDEKSKRLVFPKATLLQGWTNPVKTGYKENESWKQNIDALSWRTGSCAPVKELIRLPLFVHHNDYDIDCVTLKSPCPPHPTPEEFSWVMNTQAQALAFVIVQTSFGIWILFRENEDGKEPEEAERTDDEALFVRISNRLDELLSMTRRSQRTHGPRTDAELHALRSYLHLANVLLRSRRMQIRYIENGTNEKTMRICPVRLQRKEPKEFKEGKELKELKTAEPASTESAGGTEGTTEGTEGIEGKEAEEVDFYDQPFGSFPAVFEDFFETPPVGTPPVGTPPVGTPPVGTPPVGTPPSPQLTPEEHSNEEPQQTQQPQQPQQPQQVDEFEKELEREIEAQFPATRRWPERPDMDAETTETNLTLRPVCYSQITFFFRPPAAWRDTLNTQTSIELTAEDLDELLSSFPAYRQVLPDSVAQEADNFWSTLKKRAPDVYKQLRSACVARLRSVRFTWQSQQGVSFRLSDKGVEMRTRNFCALSDATNVLRKLLILLDMDMPEPIRFRVGVRAVIRLLFDVNMEAFQITLEEQGRKYQRFSRRDGTHLQFYWTKEDPIQSLRLKPNGELVLSIYATNDDAFKSIPELFREVYGHLFLTRKMEY